MVRDPSGVTAELGERLGDLAVGSPLLVRGEPVEQGLAQQWVAEPESALDRFDHQRGAGRLQPAPGLVVVSVGDREPLVRAERLAEQRDALQGPSDLGRQDVDGGVRSEES